MTYPGHDDVMRTTTDDGDTASVDDGAMIDVAYMLLIVSTGVSLCESALDRGTVGTGQINRDKCVWAFNLRRAHWESGVGMEGTDSNSGSGLRSQRCLS